MLNQNNYLSFSGLIFVLLVSISKPVIANEDEYQEYLEPSLNWYQVEVIIFEQKSAAFNANEQFPDTLDQIRIDRDTVNLRYPNINDNQEAYVQLPKSVFHLKDVAAKLRNNGGYRILLHTAWKQPVDKKNQTKSIRLFAGEDFGQLFSQSDTYSQSSSDFYDDFILVDTHPNSEIWEVDGKLKISLNQYLRIDTNLFFRKNLVLKPKHQQYHFYEEDNQPRLYSFHIDDSRRIKINEIQYFDHPFFGMILKVTKTNPTLTQRNTPVEDVLGEIQIAMD